MSNRRVLGYEYKKGAKIPIPITHFDFAQFDSIDDLAREELRSKGTIAPLIAQLVEYSMEDERAEIVTSLIGLVRKAKRPDLALMQAAFASGILLGKTGTELGAQFGISKQAFHAGVKKYQKLLRLRQIRTMRDARSCELMRLTNYQNHSHE